MIHHKDSNWGLVMDRGKKGGRRDKALIGHADMIPRALATLAAGRKGRAGQGDSRYVRGGGGGRIELPGSHFLFLS